MSEPTTPPGPDMTSLFSQLVIMLSSTVMQQLGAVPSPDGSRPPVDLEAAQGLIDIIAALKTKTEGNLDESEDGLLTEALSSLQMLFVQVSQQGDAPPPPPPPPPQPEPNEPAAAPTEPAAAPTEAEPSAPAESEPGEDGGDDDKQPRFKKSYG